MITDDPIEELSSDQAEELKAIRQDIKQLNDGMMSSLKAIGDTFIDTVANKEDLTAMESRIMGEITSVKGYIAELKGMMKQLLQQRSGE